MYQLDLAAHQEHERLLYKNVSLRKKINIPALDDPLQILADSTQVTRALSWMELRETEFIPVNFRIRQESSGSVCGDSASTNTPIPKHGNLFITNGSSIWLTHQCLKSLAVKYP